jgi:hypothetical protein
LNRIARDDMVHMTKTFHMITGSPAIFKEIVWGNAKPYITAWMRIDIDQENLIPWTGASVIHYQGYYHGDFILAVRSNRDVDSLTFYDPMRMPLLDHGCPIILRAGETQTCEPPYFGRFMCNTSYCYGFALKMEHAQQIANEELVIEYLVAANKTMRNTRVQRPKLLNEICEYVHTRDTHHDVLS